MAANQGMARSGADFRAPGAVNGGRIGRAVTTAVEVVAAAALFVGCVCLLTWKAVYRAHVRM